MSTIKDLRTFIQKEIHQKRFLQDADDMLAGIENLEVTEKNLGKRIGEARKELAPLEEKLTATKAKIASTEELINSKLTNCEAEIAKRLATAQDEVDKEKAKYNSKLTLRETTISELDKKIEGKTATLAAMEKQEAELQTTIANLEAEKAKLLKKFS